MLEFSGARGMSEEDLMGWDGLKDMSNLGLSQEDAHYTGRNRLRRKGGNS